MSKRHNQNDDIEGDIEASRSEHEGSEIGKEAEDKVPVQSRFKKRHLLHPKSWREYIHYVLMERRKKSKLYLLLIFLIPAIVIPRATKVSNVPNISFLNFFLNFLAIIPLSDLMTIGVEDLSSFLGPEYQSILHALSGNFVELVIESYVLMDGKYAIVRSAVLGTILCNITLVLGIAFVVGSWSTKSRRLAAKRMGTKYLHTEIETETFVDTSSSILALAFLALLIPAAFKIAATPKDTTDHHLVDCNLENISHATAIVLILVYVGFLVFQLKTHSSVIVDTKEIENHHRIGNWLFDLFLIVISVAGITVCARVLVSSIEHLAEQFELGTGFVGIVLLPICVISNFIEHYQAIAEAAEDKIDSAIGLILNTTVQMALLIIPILVSIGWISGRPLTLDFSILEISVLGCAILIVNYLVADNKANWLEGYMLVISYVLIAIAFFYFPNMVEDEAPPSSCNPWSRNLNHTLAGIGEGGGAGEAGVTSAGAE